jgi:GntR family transcriptional regulator
LTSFTEEMRRHSLVAASRTLGHRVVVAEARVAQALQIPVKSRVFVLKRVRLADGQPMSLQTAHVPASFVPGIEIAEGVSLYEVLQSRYNLYAAQARETYFASAADGPAAELLGIPAGSPVFAVERVTLMPNSRPFEFVQSIIRGDRYSIVLELVKHGVEKRKLRLRDRAEPAGPEDCF